MSHAIRFAGYVARRSDFASIEASPAELPTVAATLQLPTQSQVGAGKGLRIVRVRLSMSYGYAG